MIDVLGTYSFLPWLRQGIANNITAADNDPAVILRATIPVELELTGQAVEGDGDLTANITRDVGLYGPGDIVGIDPDVIIKTEPKHWITNFEPNYLAAIEFDPPDFLHRYTPAAPDGLHRLRPWLTLVVATEAEFQNGGAPTAPLDTITLQAPAGDVFPPADQLWAWAHVHVNKDLILTEGQTTAANDPATRSRMETVLNANSDEAYCRLVCPRRLEANTGYHAFVVPTFETGRLAGLGRNPAENAEVFATMSAWAEYTDRPLGTVYPVYHRWYFKTGTVGDFEHLVRLLKPRPPDPRLGRRDMDVQRPGARLPGITDEDLGGVLRLGGALKVPDEALSGPQEDEAETFEEWDDPYPHPFQTGLAQFINLAEDYAELPPDTANAAADGLEPEAQTDEDPLITPPLYGRWPSLTSRLLFEADGTDAPQNDNWVHELNLDPRFRVPAGFGTRIVQDNQEAYMDAAWDQVGDILEANARIRRAQLAQAATFVWHRRDLGQVNTALEPARLMTLAAPMQRRAVAQGLTLHRRVAESMVPRAALSPTLRRIVRPRDHIARRLGFDAPGGAPRLVDRINAGDVSAAPPKETSDELPTVEEVADELAPDGSGGLIGDLLRRFPLLPLMLFVLALLIAVLLFVIGLGAAGVAVGALGVAAAAVLNRLRRLIATADAVLPDANAPETIDDLPNFPNFEIADLNEGDRPTPGPGADSPEAGRFKIALKDVFQLTDLSATLGAIPERPRLDMSLVARTTFTAIDPETTIPRFTLAGISVPARFLDQFEEVFREAMAYPEIDIAMYRPLLELSDEHFLPNLDKIKPNTITLLETNQRFIEAYMVGLNHEFARELLWREYPTDQRGSYFRQFWDVKQVMLGSDMSEDERREALKDIPPLHLWSKRSKLGEHDNRELAGTQRDNLVVCIRGDLFIKYPNAVIYMQRARWQMTDGEIDTSVERELETEGEVEEIIRTPIFEARVRPDIFFFGFELTAEEAQGGSGIGDDIDAGWIVVMEERPGEPRFGLDVSRDGDLNVWNDLAWPDVPLENGRFLRIDSSVGTLVDPTGDPALGEKLVQYADDQGVAWSGNMNAAEVAYILYQVPVRVGVHASEMLRQ
ncbi:MAG: hypothetical protein AAGA19_10100 [Pseudomonadota bacterium]